MAYRNGRLIRRREPGRPLVAAAGITLMTMLATLLAAVVDSIVFQLGG